jgi:hypothetical protein
MTDHKTGEIFCTCNSCPHSNSFQCEDYKCSCCTGKAIGTYHVTYLKDVGPAVKKF